MRIQFSFHLVVPSKKGPYIPLSAKLLPLRVRLVSRSFRRLARSLTVHGVRLEVIAQEDPVSVRHVLSIF